MKKLKAGQFIGSYYLRGGLIRDKHGNVYKKSITLRQRGSGFVISPSGKWIGKEPPYNHHYGQDPKKTRKPATFVKPNSITALKRRSAHIRRLR